MRNQRKAFALIEVMIAVLFIGLFLLALLQVRNQTLHSFIRSGDQYSGAWLAEMKMAEVISQNLPDPEDADTWVLEERGDFEEFDRRLNEINQRVNENWVERRKFADFEWEATKELIFVGPDFIGTEQDLELWEPPLDEYGNEITDDDPREKPAARIVRVTLIVYMPEERYEAPGGERPQGRQTIKLVTYVDPNVLYDADAEDDTAPMENP